MLPEQYTMQDSGFKNSNTKKFLSYLAVVLCAVAGILLAYAYIIYFHGEKNGSVVATQQPEPQISEQSESEKIVEEFFRDRNYQQSIDKLEELSTNVDKKVGGGVKKKLS